MKRLIVHDTTLRDGDQTPGVNFSLSQKTELALLLEDAGVDVIEAGFPVASPGDFKSVQAVAAAVKNAGVSALARASRPDIDRVREALSGARHPRVHIVIATSDLHLKYKLKLSREEVLAATREAVSYARSFCEDVQFSAEDATRSERDFLCRVLREAQKAGASTLNVPDTVGVATPEEYAALLKYLSEAIDLGNTVLSVHCHNDLGLAAANTLAGLHAGALQAECTVNALGERAGNAALEEIVMALHTKKEYYGFSSAVNTKKLLSLSKAVSTLSGIPVAPGKPIVGANAFSHESGIHQHGMLQNEKTYQLLDPADLGLAKSTLLLGKLSGRHAFSAKATELGFSLTPEQLERAFASFLQLADRKKLVRDDEVEAILQDVLDAEIQSRGYQIESFQIQSVSPGQASASVTLSKNDARFQDAAVGSGPIEAAFHAVERIVDRDLTLESYRIRAVTEGADSLGVVQVKIRCRDSAFTGRGVSLDIIEASVKAYVNAINRAIYYTEEEGA